MSHRVGGEATNPEKRPSINKRTPRVQLKRAFSGSFVKKRESGRSSQPGYFPGLRSGSARRTPVRQGKGRAHMELKAG